jgi:hypothetical protein
VTLESDPNDPQAPVERGRMDRALDYLHRRRAHGDQTTTAIPVRISGIEEDQLVLVDRSQFRIMRADGRLLYEHVGAGAAAGLYMDTEDDAITDGLASQLIDVPVNVDAESGAPGERLQIEYSLTLLGVQASHTLAADGGVVHSADIGACATQLHRNAVTLSCRAIGAAPACYRAAVYSADGRLGAEATQCAADYRRHWPTLIDVLSPYGVVLPLRGSDAMDPAELARAHLVLEVYGERAHFTRSLTAALPAAQ